MVALDTEHLLFDVFAIVVPAALVLFKGFFENIEFVLVASLLGPPLEPRPKEPKGQRQGR
jgi:hypothetical protein